MNFMEFLKNIFSISDYSEERYMIRLFGAKLRLQKSKFRKLRKQNAFYYYKKNNIDITTIPPAIGQIRDIQLANLALLREMDYVCKQAGLRYWLDAGTLIGSLRHKGFIPWDDDIDTAMPREDYEKFIEAFNKLSRNKDIYAGYNRETPNPIIRVLHRNCPYIYIDIFPFQPYGVLPELKDRLKISANIKRFINKNKKLYKEENLVEYRDDLIEKFKEKFVSTAVQTDDKNLFSYVWGPDHCHVWKDWFTPYNVIFPLKTIMFEGYEFSCMNNPDAFLTRVYGNYMGYPRKMRLGHNAYKTLSEQDKAVLAELVASLDK